MNNIFLAGDFHGGHTDIYSGICDIDKISKKKWPLQEDLTKEDVLIQLGDFGYIWFHDQHPKFPKDQRYLKNLSEKNYTFAFVDGNHENHDILDASPIVEKWGSEVNEVYPGIFRLRRGHVYTINGKTIFVMGGARSNENQKDGNYSGRKGSRYRKLKNQKQWWSRELPSEEEYELGRENLAKVNNKVDIVLTHTCPSFLLEKILNKTGQIDVKRIDDPVSIYLDEIYNILEFDEWHFGHHHQDVMLKIDKEIFFAHYNDVPTKVQA